MLKEVETLWKNIFLRKKEREKSLKAHKALLPKIEASIMKIWDEACISLTT
jgi:hypothetical protein